MAAPTAAQLELSTYLEADSAARLMRFVRATSPTLATSMRARLRVAAADTVAAIQDKVREDTPEGTPLVAGGARDTLAAGTKLSILTGVRTYGIRITTSGTKLTAAHAAILKAYNTKSWRHPTIGDHGQFVEEQGRPYFGSVVMERQAAFDAAAALVFEDVAAQITY